MKSYTELYKVMNIMDKYIYKIIPIIQERIKGGVYTIEGINVPPFVIAILHFMESSGDLRKSVKNGRKLPPNINFKENAKSVFLMFFQWQKSQFKYDSIEDLGFFFESWNGMGYRMRGLYSPYLWAGTSIKTIGKYIADGTFTYKAVSKQVGAMAYIQALQVFPELV